MTRILQGGWCGEKQFLYIFHHIPQNPHSSLGRLPVKMSFRRFVKWPQFLDIGKIYQLTTRRKTMKLLSLKIMYHVSSLFVSFRQIFWISTGSSDERTSVQLLEDEPFAAFKPTVESLIADKDQNKQRAAAEFLAGILGGKVSYGILPEICWNSARFKALADWQTRCTMDMVHSSHNDYISSKHQNRYFNDLDVLFRSIFLLSWLLYTASAHWLCSTCFIIKTLVGCSLW